tara:strand:- start:149 stop:433 length:285 start_codon:yes stop_codon:yes gene_type:complete
MSLSGMAAQFTRSIEDATEHSDGSNTQAKGNERNRTNVLGKIDAIEHAKTKVKSDRTNNENRNFFWENGQTQVFCFTEGLTLALAFLVGFGRIS